MYRSNEMMQKYFILERTPQYGDDDDQAGRAAQLKQAKIEAALAIMGDYPERFGGGLPGGVRAKMTCNGIESFQYGRDPKATTRKVRLGAVYGTEGENKDFADATPSGECWMMIDASRPALAFFEPGKKYYVTFTPAPD